MQAKNMEEFRQKLKIWHDEHLQVYDDFLKTVEDARKGDMKFFENNVSMLGFNVLEEIDISQADGIGYYMPSQLLERTKPHNQEYAEQIKQNVLEDDPNTLCMYYFILYDNGAFMMAEILKENAENFTKTPDTDLRNMYDGMIRASVKNDVVKKGEWKSFAKDTLVDGLRKMLESVLITVKGLVGKRDKRRQLNDLLIDKDEKLYERIQYYLAHRHSDTDIACLKRALDVSKHLSKCSYSEFFRSLQQEFKDYNIKSMERGQELYNDLSNNTKGAHLNISSNVLEKAKEISRRLEKDFSSLLIL